MRYPTLLYIAYRKQLRYTQPTREGTYCIDAEQGGAREGKYILKMTAFPNSERVLSDSRWWSSVDDANYVRDSTCRLAFVAAQCTRGDVSIGATCH